MSNHRGRVALGFQKPLWHSSTNPILATIPKSVQGETVASILQIEKPGFSRIGRKVQKRKFRFPKPRMVLFHALSWADTRCFQGAWLSSKAGEGRGRQQVGRGAEGVVVTAWRVTLLWVSCQPSHHANPPPCLFI